MNKNLNIIAATRDVVEAWDLQEGDALSPDIHDLVMELKKALQENTESVEISTTVEMNSNEIIIPVNNEEVGFVFNGGEFNKILDTHKEGKVSISLLSSPSNILFTSESKEHTFELVRRIKKNRKQYDI